MKDNSRRGGWKEIMTNRCDQKSVYGALVYGSKPAKPSAKGPILIRNILKTKKMYNQTPGSNFVAIFVWPTVVSWVVWTRIQ